MHSDESIRMKATLIILVSIYEVDFVAVIIIMAGPASNVAFLIVGLLYRCFIII